MKRLALAVAAALAFAPPAHAAPSCAITTTLTLPGRPASRARPKGPPQHAYRLNDGSVVFLGRMTIDADGASRAYHPDGVSGLDYLADAGHPGDWWALATDAPACGATGVPVVQGPDDPAPGFYVSTTSLIDPQVTDCRRQRRYVDADAISFVALPSAIARFSVGHDRGNLVVVQRATDTAPRFAIFADASPASGLAEGSMQLARSLGLPANPKHGGDDRRDLLYVVLPQTGASPRSDKQLTLDGQAAFETWGGAARLAVCRAAVLARPL